MKTEIILNFEQKKILDEALNGRNLCILASGGSGKTVLLKAIIHCLKQDKKNVIVCAPTGTASEQVGGLTIHRTFGFEEGPAITKTGKLKERAPKPIITADVIIIDEISMVRMDYFDGIIASIRKANKARKEKLKADIQIIIAGDFYQLPPVLPDDERFVLESYYGKAVGGAYAFQASSWRDCNFYYATLNRSLRQADKEFIFNLEKLRIGDISCITYFNTQCQAKQIDDAISIFPYREEAARENRKRMARVEGPEAIFNTIYTGSADRFDLSGIAEVLRLKVDIPVMFARNQITDKFVDCINPSLEKTPITGLYHNGDVGKILSIERGHTSDQDYVILEVHGRILGLIRHEFRAYNLIVRNGKLGTEKTGTFFQFPIIPAYAITIHKAQGKTFEKLNVEPSCFTAGQLYVAMSRCRAVHNISLIKPITPECLIINNEVRHFYKSIEDYIS